MTLLDLLYTLRVAFVGNRIRSILTLLGVMIGSGSIVMLAGLLQGGREALLRLDQGITGAQLLEVEHADPPMAQRQRTSRPLSAHDAEALSAMRALGTEGVGGIIERPYQASFRSRTQRVTLVGAGPDALRLYGLSMAKGRFLDASDGVRGARVCVVGHEVAEQLLGEAPGPLGLRVIVNGVSWQVVGVLAHKPTMGGGNGTWMWDRKVLIPKESYDAAYSTGHLLSKLLVRLPSGEDLQQGLARIKSLVRETLLRRHHGVQNFAFADEKGEEAQSKVILMVVQLLLMSTGLMSLFVGGINIMNIMLVTISERTREIGIRRAVGASRAWIVIQFLAESAAVALVGGIGGVLGGLVLSWLAALGLEKALGAWRFYAEPWSIAAGIGLALVTGILFGLMPALRAAKLDPVEALRSS